jgi:RimJ/RimL family protein N-acetyltransferase
MSCRETKRLSLRPLVPDDRDWAVAVYAGVVGATREDAQRVVVVALAHERIHGFGHIVAELVATGERDAIDELHQAGEGLVGIDEGEVEIGWVVATEHQGRGIATEAASAVASEALDRVDHVVAYVRPGNIASLRVVEKLGMRHRGPGRSRSGNHVEIFELRGERRG